jgi:hypothetical protein
MSQDQVKKASAKHLAKLLAELPDDKERHGVATLIGGNRELCRELLEVAKLQPGKALAVLALLDPEKQQNAAAHLFQGLCDRSVPNEESEPWHRQVCGLFLELVGRDFGRKDYRDYFCWGLRKLAKRPSGLPDNVLTVLVAWLGEAEPHALSSETDSADKGTTYNAADSVVFPRLGGGGIVPHGSYPIVEAALCGYLHRTNPEIDNAFRVLESRKDIGESVAFWQNIFRTFNGLFASGAERGAVLLFHLFATVPGLLERTESFNTAWHCLFKLDETRYSAFLDLIAAQDTERARQAVGELVFARSALKSGEAAIQARLQLAAASGFGTPQGIGVLHTAVALWHEADARSQASTVVVEAMRSGDARAAGIALGIFDRSASAPQDNFTVEALEAALTALECVDAKATETVLRDLPNLLVLNPDRVVALVEAFLRRAVQDRSGETARVAGYDIHLTQLAIAIHGMVGFEDRGLAIFETLMQLRIHTIPGVLKSIDRWRPF